MKFHIAIKISHSLLQLEKVVLPPPKLPHLTVYSQHFSCTDTGQWSHYRELKRKINPTRTGSLNHTMQSKISTRIATNARQTASIVGPSSSVPVNYLICPTVLWNSTLIQQPKSSFILLFSPFPQIQTSVTSFLLSLYTYRLPVWTMPGG